MENREDLLQYQLGKFLGINEAGDMSMRTNWGYGTTMLQFFKGCRFVQIATSDNRNCDEAFPCEGDTCTAENILTIGKIIDGKI